MFFINLTNLYFYKLSYSWTTHEWFYHKRPNFPLHSFIHRTKMPGGIRAYNLWHSSLKLHHSNHQHWPPSSFVVHRICQSFSNIECLALKINWKCFSPRNINHLLQVFPNASRTYETFTSLFLHTCELKCFINRL